MVKIPHMYPCPFPTPDPRRLAREYSPLAYSLKVVIAKRTLKPLELDKFNYTRPSITNKLEKLRGYDVSDAIRSKLTKGDSVKCPQAFC